MSDTDALVEALPRLMSAAMSCLALQMVLHPFSGGADSRTRCRAPGAEDHRPGPGSSAATASGDRPVGP